MASFITKLTLENISATFTICTGPSARQTCEAGPLDKLVKPGQALAGALTMPLHCGAGTRKPAQCLVLPQPKPGSQFTILLGAKWRKKDVDVFFSPVVTGT